MNNITTSIAQSLFNNENNLPAFEQVVTEFFRSELESSLNEILAYELTAFLDYEKYARSDNVNSRNGSYSRKMDTKFGSITLKIPRDRLGEFYTAFIPKYKRRDSSTEATILSLFEKGMTNSEIVSVIEELCGARYSGQTISNITDHALDCIDAFKKRTLNKEYAVVFLDGTAMALRRDTVSKEMVHIALGITVEGTKEILGYLTAPCESAEAWKELLQDIKDRGVEKVSLFCTDGLSGMEEAINDLFPRSNIQRCMVHIQRNIKSKCRVKDQSDIMSDFKTVYKADDKEEAQAKFNEFLEKWGKKYPKIKGSLEKTSNLFTFYDYPESVRSTIYTTNLIEANNKQLKRNFKKKEQFPNEQAQEKYLVSEFNKYNQKNMGRVHKGFGKTVRSDWFKDEG